MSCKLCQQPKPLRNSHIIPEFVYAPLYDTRHRTVGVNGRGRLGRKLLQQGLTEPLLCNDCEQLLNDYYEKPFKKFWFDQTPLPKVLGPQGCVITGIEYAAFKLFHLSILFRASVAKSPTFSQVSLGPYEATFRRMLLAKDPGQSDQYPVFAFAVVDHRSTPLWRLLIPPFRGRFEGHNVYATLFGGCMWYCTVSKHRSPLMLKVGLQTQGTMRIIPEAWETVSAIQEVSKVLNGAL